MKLISEEISNAEYLVEENNGKKDTTTSLSITALGGISSAGGFGASEGFK